MKSRNIAILSLPIRTNYGGILQAFALQYLLIHRGYKVEHLAREADYVSLSFWCSLKSCVKYYIRKILRKTNTIPNASQFKFIAKNTQHFIDENIIVSPSLYSENRLISYFKKKDFDTLIVGSDQVWRPSMCENPLNYFLNFVDKAHLKRISYAASFGVDTWEFSKEMTSISRKLIKKFNAVSVREESGVFLCKEKFGVDAEVVADPTLLIDKSIYETIAATSIDWLNNGKIFCYFLDNNATKKEIVRYVENYTGLAAFYCMPQVEPTPDNIEKFGSECVFPPVSCWLKSFMEAEIVLTDSFHGAIFSIIFNRPMWIVGNVQRGMARFNSLLKTFDLQDRLISSETYKDVQWDKSINWEEVNNKKNAFVNASLNFLDKNLEM